MTASFSRRLDWDAPENGLATAEARARADHARFVDLTTSNPTVVGLPDPSAAVSRALGSARAGVYLPSPRGAAAARRAVADEYEARGARIAPERLLLTASSSESYAFLFKLLCDPGDVVLVPSPSYPLFDYLARLEGVRPVPYRLVYGLDRRWRVDLRTVDDALEQVDAGDGRVRAVIVVNPNNPTGSVLDETDAAALDERCAARGAALISDEVFADFVRRPPPDPVSCLAARATAALTFSLGGLSKSCGLPQLKVGWIAVGGPEEAARQALDRLELVADTYLSVNTAAANALPELLDLGTTFRGHLATRLDANEAELARAVAPGSPLTALPTEGGWSVLLRVPAVLSDEAWTLTLLERERVLVQPGYFFDLEGGTFLVISLLPPEATFTSGLARTVHCVERLTSEAH